MRQRPGGGLAGVPAEARMVRALPPLARRAAPAGPAAGGVRRLQRGPRGARRLGPEAVGGADALLAARAGGAEASDRVRPRRHLPEAPPRARPLQLVGLPDARLPEEPGPAAGPHLRDRPAPGRAASGRHRPGGPEGDPALRPRAGLGTVPPP